MFQTFLERKHVRQILAYQHSAICMIQARFIGLANFIGIPTLLTILYKATLLST
jgi:hypothetical protein